ncbi:unnamed protein product, partial [Litomosoides sigmodontis]
MARPKALSQIKQTVPTISYSCRKSFELLSTELYRWEMGDILEVPFKYLHRPQQSNQRDFVIQTSEFRSLGVGIDFSIHCAGKRIQGRQCPNVAIGEQIDFFAKVSLNECKSGGDIAISIGAYGYQTVSAMYITPSCGCECEKMQNQERKSPLCYGAGDLICGVCECHLGKGGSHCECDLKEHGVRGEFCECENMSCPVFQGRMCTGQGECRCGKCHCEEGYAGDDCSCALDTSPCREGGVGVAFSGISVPLFQKICNGQGTCECGKCVCHEGFTGLTCGVVAENEVSEDEMSDFGGIDQLSKDGEGKVGYDQSRGGNLDEITNNEVKDDEYGEPSDQELREAGDMRGGEILPPEDDSDTGGISADLATNGKSEADSEAMIAQEGQT